jgi:hypothetical protein
MKNGDPNNPDVQKVKAERNAKGGSVKNLK